MKCDVCGSGKDTRVASSAMGAVSFSYCTECLVANREPWAALVGGLVGCRSMEDVASWARPIVRATCEFYERSLESLFLEIEVLEREYVEAMRKEDEGGGS